MTRFRNALLSGFLICTAIWGPASMAQVPVPGKSAPKSGANQLTGAGSTFVYPMMNKWASVYHEKKKVQVNYQSIGSGGGIKQFSSKTVDFGATDGPMSDDEIKNAGGDVLHVPVIMGAVSVVYNLPGVSQGVQLDSQVLADIFLGKIKKWNDPAIVSQNKGIKLPDSDIVVAHRSDGSGTTYIFSEYLGGVSPEWKSKVGVGKSLNWPVGLGGKGNEGVAALVKNTPNSIGYVEMVYAVQTKMSQASLKNREGNYVQPSVDTVTEAAGSLKDYPADLRMSIVNAPGKSAYPISGLVWVLAREKNANAAAAGSLRTFLDWVLSEEGQGYAAPLQYSRLPKELLEKARIKAGKIQ